MLQPQLATLVDGPPSDPAEWLYEIKFDGYRILTRIDAGKIQLFTRSGNDWSHKLAHLVKAIGERGLSNGWLGGEVIVLNENGIQDFQALQKAFDSSRMNAIIYYVFDIPFYDGYDLRTSTLAERREFLKTLFETRSSETIRFSATFDVPASDIIASACRIGLEGVIGKRKTSTYVSRRSPNWIKLKCSQRQEFVIGGYTDPQGSRIGIGSLLLGFYDEEKKLRYAGNVGAGFSDKTLRDLKAQLDKVAAADNLFFKATGIGRKVHWVKPELVAEVSFGEWTREGHIRHNRIYVSDIPVSIRGNNAIAYAVQRDSQVLLFLGQQGYCIRLCLLRDFQTFLRYGQNILGSGQLLLGFHQLTAELPRRYPLLKRQNRIDFLKIVCALLHFIFDAFVSFQRPSSGPNRTFGVYLFSHSFGDGGKLNGTTLHLSSATTT